ncbi:MAG: hypothetical protein EA350_10965 [Gemmatimonadales bacterium]|nr:MAG: hypothetical protein EA350_10965 [Gemmatimonadales bacterium]
MAPTAPLAGGRLREARPILLGVGGGVAAFIALVWLAVVWAGDWEEEGEEPWGGPVAAEVATETQYVSLVGGFIPDPHSVDVMAGGPAAPDQPGCTYGNVPVYSSVLLTYTGGSGRTLTMASVGDGSTTLHVILPDDRGLCDRDSFGGNPMLSIPNAEDGDYYIWVGAMGDNPIPARLYLSEWDPAELWDMLPDW